MASIQDNLRCLTQALDLLDQLSDEDYAHPFPTPLGCAIGAQLRHIIDHYTCLLRGIRDGVVDYEDRPRDQTIARSRAVARQTLEAIMDELRALPADRTHRPLSVQIATGALADVHSGPAPSSLARELQFVLLHTVHHYALIAVELRTRGLPCDPDLGVAPATLAWRQQQASA
ncbi:MAG: DinB family protein [Myxococcota bacterium]